MKSLGDYLTWNDGTKTEFENFKNVDLDNVNFIQGKAVLFDFIISDWDKLLGIMNVYSFINNYQKMSVKEAKALGTHICRIKQPIIDNYFNNQKLSSVPNQSSENENQNQNQSNKKTKINSVPNSGEINSNSNNDTDMKENKVNSKFKRSKNSFLNVINSVNGNGKSNKSVSVTKHYPSDYISKFNTSVIGEKIFFSTYIYEKDSIKYSVDIDDDYKFAWSHFYFYNPNMKEFSNNMIMNFGHIYKSNNIKSSHPLYANNLKNYFSIF